jgi:hypothetical protein
MAAAASGALVVSTGLVAAVSIGGFHILGFRPHPGNTAGASVTTTNVPDPLCTTTTIAVAAAPVPPDTAVTTVATVAPLPANCPVPTTIAPTAVTVPVASPPVTCAPGADPTTCP